MREQIREKQSMRKMSGFCTSSSSVLLLALFLLQTSSLAQAFQTHVKSCRIPGSPEAVSRSFRIFQTPEEHALLGGQLEVTIETASSHEELEPSPLIDQESSQLTSAVDKPSLSSPSKDSIQVPSVSTILAFAIPAIGVWLCSPLLSMIDTSTVGLFAGTAQQAALNPAVAVTDYSARTMSFLFTGTTNMVALARGRGGDDSSETAKRTFAGALQLSLLVGTGLGMFLFVFARPLVRALIGNDSLDATVLAAAVRYIRIRALGMPPAAIIGTAQAACLGLQDVKSPLNVIAVAAIVNLVLDLLLVGNPSPWIGGAAGAAWATIASQYFAMSLFLKWLCSKRSTSQSKPVRVPRGLTTRFAMIMPRFSSRQQAPKKAASSSFSTRGFLADSLSFRGLFRKPSDETTKGFSPYVIPVTTTQVGRCSTYIAMGHVVSSSFGTISMAANQIITSIFYSLIPIADSLSLTAQTFLPPILAKPQVAERASALKQTTLNLLKVAGMMGLALAGIVACIPLASKLFTTDPAVMSLVREIVPVLFVIFSLHGVFCGSEGILLGQRDLKFLGRMYAIYFAVVPYLMLRIKTAAQAGVAVSLSSVWNLFLGYQLFRISVWVGRVGWLQYKRDRKSLAM